MEAHTILIGSIESTNSGFVQENTHEVEFVGELLAYENKLAYDDRRGGLTDTRGTTRTLYRTDKGKLVVHIHEWSRWQGEPDSYYLLEADEADLGPNGRFWMLGKQAGFGRPLTLEEALKNEEL